MFQGRSCIQRTLSCAPVTNMNVVDDLTDKINMFVNVVVQGWPVADTWVEEITRYMREGWLEKEKLKGIVQHYWSYRAQLTLVNEFLLYKSRIVIPSALCQDVLDKLHEGHQGIVKCR